MKTKKSSFWSKFLLWTFWKVFLLQAFAGFFYWTVILTPYMVFIVGVDWLQYFKWLGMELILIPPFVSGSIWSVNWLVKLFIKEKKETKPIIDQSFMPVKLLPLFLELNDACKKHNAVSVLSYSIEDEKYEGEVAQQFFILLTPTSGDKSKEEEQIKNDILPYPKGMGIRNIDIL